MKTLVLRIFRDLGLRKFLVFNLLVNKKPILISHQTSLYSDKISEYFGIKIAFYFAWLGHYTTALTVPAIVGLASWVITFYKHFI